MPEGKFNQSPNNMSRRDFLKTSAVGMLAISGLDKLEGAEEGTDQVENKFINKDGHCEYVYSSQDAGKAHEGANVFAREVGNALRASYPSKILEPKVKLEILKVNGHKLYRLTWTCKIVKASPAEADYHFDRRGSLKPGKTLEEAKQAVEKENEKKIQPWRDSIKGSNIPPSFVQDSHAGNDKDGYWYIKEFFLVAPK